MKDYANKNYNQKKRVNRSKSRAKTKSNAGENKQFWRYWAIGLVIVIAALVGAQVFYKHYMKEQTLAANKAKMKAMIAAESTNKTAPIAHISSTHTKAKALPEKPKFDFYTVLPKSGTTQTASTTTAPATKTVTVSRQPKSFMLQVASYRNNKDAKSMQARLLLLGLSPIVKKTGSGWYRVDLGPYNSVRSADVVRHKIQKAGINGSMTRQVALSN